MAKKANPRRYATAVFQIAQEKNDYDKWQSDLQHLAAAAADASFLDVLESPRLALADKTRFLKQTLPGLNPLAVNLVLLLVSRDIVNIIPGIAAQYLDLINESRGIAAADVITAVPLDNADKEKLKTQLSALTGAAVEIKTEVDPAILGGVIARVGGKLLDGSTRSKLAALKRTLESGI
jgi:F-type H+-transporting ATPase subunit delta